MPIVQRDQARHVSRLWQATRHTREESRQLGLRVRHERKHEQSSKLTRAEASAVLYDVMGDDLDGVASMMDDAQYMGWVE